MNKNIIIDEKLINHKLLELEKKFLKSCEHLDKQTRKTKKFYLEFLNDYRKNCGLFYHQFASYKERKFLTDKEGEKYLSTEDGAKDFIIDLDKDIRYLDGRSIVQTFTPDWENSLLDTLRNLEIKLNIKEKLSELEEKNQRIYDKVAKDLINNFGALEVVAYYNIYAEKNNIPTLKTYGHSGFGLVKDQNGNIGTLSSYYKSTPENDYIGKKIILELIDDFNKNESEQEYNALPYDIETSICKSIRDVRENMANKNHHDTIKKINDLNLHQPAINSVLDEILNEIGDDGRINVFNQMILENKLNSDEQSKNNNISDDDMYLLFSAKNIIDHIANDNTFDTKINDSLIRSVNIAIDKFEREIKKVKKETIGSKPNTNKPKFK